MADEEEFSFMEEKVMGSKKPRRQLVGTIKRAAVSGVVFGILAGISFCVTEALLTKKQTTPKEKVVLETSQNPEGDHETDYPEDGEKLENKDDTDQKNGLGILDETYNRVLRLEKSASKKLVAISVYASDADDSDLYADEKVVSGIILARTSSKVIILTQNSALTQDGVRVTFFDGSKVAGKVENVDKRLDLAVVSVDKDRIADSTWVKLKSAVMGDSSFITMGDTVFAFGSPNGNTYSMEYGYLTAEGQKKSIEDYQLDVYTTSMAYHGKGFAMICNAEGDMIGLLVKGGESMESCSFYGISKLKLILEYMINQTSQRYSGIIASEIPEDLMSKHNLRAGIYVSTVEQGSPAYEADIMIGDVIMEVNGEAVTSIVNYYKLLQQYEEGEAVRLTVVRNPFGRSKEKKIKVVLASRS